VGGVTYAGRNALVMKVTSYISTRNVVTIEASAKADAIAELAIQLKRTRRVSNAQEVIDRVLERESLETTGIGRGVAIPHALCPTGNKLVCAVGICNEPIDFRAFDGKPVRLVFLIVYPSTDTQKYLHFVSLIARMFSESKYRKAILDARTPETLYKALVKSDNAFIEAAAKAAAAAQATDTPIAALDDKRVDLLLLTRLQRLLMIKSSRKRPSKELLDEIEQVRSCIEPAVSSHFDKLMARPGGMAVVAVEGAVCQGCYMKLPDQFIHDLRESDRVHTCPTCGRFIFDVIGM